MIQSRPGPLRRPAPEPERETPLPAHRAFLVQLHADADPARRLTGRVEHVRSGQAAHFGSLDELLAFVGQVLTQ